MSEDIKKAEEIAEAWVPATFNNMNLIIYGRQCALTGIHHGRSTKEPDREILYDAINFAYAKVFTEGKLKLTDVPNIDDTIDQFLSTYSTTTTTEGA
jgi:hypothetical protein